MSICTHDRLLIEQQEHYSFPFFCFYADYFLFSASGFKVLCGDLAILFVPESIAYFFENIRVGVPTSFNFSYSRITYFPTETFLEKFLIDSVRIE